MKIFHPIHVNPKCKLLEEAFDLTRQGGYIDLTCGITETGRPVECITEAKEYGIPLERITISSDGIGSWSTYDESGSLLQIGYAAVDTVYQELKLLIKDYNFSLEEALCFTTVNTAKSLDLFPQRGKLPMEKEYC